MKSKLFIFFIFLAFNLFSQVPDTDNFKQSDVETEIGGSFKKLSELFTNSNAAYFDATYGSKIMSPQKLSGFRNYGAILSCPNIGDTYQGGLVAYLYVSGDPGYVSGECHGFIVSTSDLGNTIYWGCDGTNLSGASGTGLGTGLQNTIDIITGCTTSGIPAKLCYDYSNAGYSDWYLPSKQELGKIQDSKTILGIPDNSYWSSSEVDSGNAWAENFGGAGVQAAIWKTAVVVQYVRAIRYF